MRRRPGPRLRRAAALGLLAGGGLVLAPASVAWERPTVLTTPAASVDGPYLTVDARGDALLAWGRGRPSPEEWGLPPSYRVEAALRPAGASGWSAAQLLSPADELALRPVPVLHPSGVGVVWWTRIRRGVMDVTTAEAAHGGGWSFAPLETETGVWTERAAATAPDGTLAVAEMDPWEDDPELRLLVRTPDGAWHESPAPEVMDPSHLQVAVTAGGTVVVASLEGLGEWGSPAARTRIVTASWDPVAAAWSLPQRSAYTRGGASDLRLATTPDGTLAAAVVLRRGDGFAVAAASRPPGGPFGSWQALGSDADPEVAIAAAPTGEVVLAWATTRGMRVSVRRSGAAWSPAEAPPAGVCLRPQSVAALAAGPSGEILLVAMAGYQNDWHPGMLRAWVRRADGGWTGPVWLSRPFAGSPVAAIDGTGRMHLAWNREGRRNPVVEATSATAADAGVPAVRMDPVATLSRLRVVARGRARVVRFRLSRPGRVVVSVRPVPRRDDVPSRDVVVAGRRGANAVPIRVTGAERVPPGRWAVTVTHEGTFIAGCPVTSAPFRLR